jgi:gluconolactonase
VSETFEILCEEMESVLRQDSQLQCLGQGYGFLEGPIWWPALGGLLFSDIPGNTIHLWTENGGCRPWRHPSHNANGNAVDARGRLITCEHGSRTVTRTTVSGEVSTVAAAYQGKKLNSPNDAVVKRDGTLWFTDPPYGIKSEMSEQAANYVFRLDGDGSEPVVVVSDLSRPNGLCFSPDERLLYIADSDHERHHIRRFQVRSDNTLSGGEVFAVIDPGVPDGMRMDVTGRLFTSAGDGVQVYAADGRLLGRIRTPKPAANCTFGGDHRRCLFITARDALWAVHLAAQGAV